MFSRNELKTKSLQSPSQSLGSRNFAKAISNNKVLNVLKVIVFISEARDISFNLSWKVQLHFVQLFTANTVDSPVGRFFAPICENGETSI